MTMQLILAMMMGCLPAKVPCNEGSGCPDGEGEYLGEGYFECSDGSINRACAQPVRKPNQSESGLTCEPACSGSEECIYTPWTERVECIDLCSVDEDCPSVEGGPPRVCMSSLLYPAASRCVNATCSQNSDCASGECAVMRSGSNLALNAYLYCREPTDECRYQNFRSSSCSVPAEVRADCSGCIASCASGECVVGMWD